MVVSSSQCTAIRSFVDENIFSRINNNNIENANKDFVYKIEKDLFILQFNEEYIKRQKKDAINQSIEIAFL